MWSRPVFSMISPRVGSIARTIIRPRVVLPEPDSPTIDSVSPALTYRFTSSTARTWPVTRLQQARCDREVLCQALNRKNPLIRGWVRCLSTHLLAPFLRCAGSIAQNALALFRKAPALPYRTGLA